MLKILSRGLWAALAASALIAAPAVADTAHVRIEGDGVSLSKTVDVPTGGTFGPEDCPYDTAGGAIEVATGGNWDRSAFTQVILGERHAYEASDWWNFWINRTWSQKGICDASQPLQDGDEVLMIVQRDDASFNPTVFPLFITSAPSSVERGQAAQVSVAEHVYSYATSTTTAQPAQGATVAGGGASATTGSDGRATLTFGQAGAVEVRATASQRARSNAAGITVTEAGQAAAPTASGETSQGVTAVSATGPDRTGPRALIAGIRDGRVFRRRRAPRELRGSATDASGILMVKLRLVRFDRKRCTTWSATRERFVRRGRAGQQCRPSRGFWFKVAEQTDWRYLLPARLPRGRYVLDVNAIDRAYNRDDERRAGENRVRFRVR